MGTPRAETGLRILPTLAAALLATAFAGCAMAPAQTDAEKEGAADPLFEAIATLDTAVFDSFNKCSTPDQLQRHGSYFAVDVEFYHDTGGVTWTRQDMLANTQKYACGNFRRELLPGTLRVYPIKDFGAIAQGAHRFCQLKTGSCDGTADFLIVWRNQGGNWSITRVFSYGHRESH
jgi:hypothetical protein